VLELGDTCIAKNDKHGLYCDLEFKTKVLNSKDSRDDLDTLLILKV
jgi:hypothetical protein